MALFTSQSGVSKAIKELEEELGLEIFQRKGKRLMGFTEAGASVAAHAERALQEIENLRAVGQSVCQADEGRLVLATTHTQARYALPRDRARLPRALPQGAAGAAPGKPSGDLRLGGNPARPTSALPRNPSPRTRAL